MYLSSTMNDCRNIILDYTPYNVLFSLSKEIMYKYLPSTININSFEEYEQFKKWCKLFNMSKVNITKVNFNITYPKIRFNGLSYKIDYVPSCVKNVEILKLDSVSPIVLISLPDTVEYLKVDNTLADITKLPANIKHLVLGYKYHGAITSYESNLEIVEFYGYDSGSRFPCQINDLPDTIHTIKIYTEFQAHITYWPPNAQIIIEDPYDERDDLDNLDLFDY